jgi:hypothetical protein
MGGGFPNGYHGRNTTKPLFAISTSVEDIVNIDVQFDLTKNIWTIIKECLQVISTNTPILKDLDRVEKKTQVSRIVSMQHKHQFFMWVRTFNNQNLPCICYQIDIICDFDWLYSLFYD